MNAPTNDLLVWDNHACMPIRAETSFLPQLERYRASGVHVVSLNVVYDMLPWTLGVQVLATFRRWLTAHSDHYTIVTDVDSILEARRSGRLAVTFDIEGMCALDGRTDMVSLYHDLGVRWMLVAYNQHNMAGGGCLDPADPGLSPFGRQVLDEMRRVGMVACCSHTGERTVMDVFEHAGMPVIVSHSNPRALCDHPRNVTRRVIEGCAATGGVVGIVGFGLFLRNGDVSAENIARHIDHVVQIVGPEHVGFSTDHVFDRAELEEFLVLFRRKHPDAFPDSAGQAMMEPEAFPALIEALQRLGYADDDLRAIMGGNWMRVARDVWRG